MKQSRLTPKSSNSRLTEASVYVDLGYAYENDGNLDKALENYLKAIELNQRPVCDCLSASRNRLPAQAGNRQSNCNV